MQKRKAYEKELEELDRYVKHRPKKAKRHYSKGGNDKGKDMDKVIEREAEAEQEERRLAELAKKAKDLETKERLERNADQLEKVEEQKEEDTKTSYTPPELKPIFTTQAEGVRLRFDRAEDLKKFVQSVNYVKGREAEGNLQVRKDGLTLMRMDPSSISMVTADMPSKAFPIYDVKKEGKLGLDLDALKQAVKDVKKDERAELVQEGDNLKVKIIGQYDTANDKANIRETVLPLLDIPKSVEKEPKLELAAHAEVNAKKLKDSLSRAEEVSSYAKLTLKDNTLMITAKGDDKEFKEEYVVKGQGEAYARYNIEFLRGFLKATNKDTTVNLDMKTQEPLKLEYHLADQNARYWLAPYMED